MPITMPPMPIAVGSRSSAVLLTSSFTAVLADFAMREDIFSRNFIARLSSFYHQLTKKKKKGAAFH
jgi:hypothetical protein